MKAMFGVAVFGLLPVPPMPACDALSGHPADRPTATEDIGKLRFEGNADGAPLDVTKDEAPLSHFADIDPQTTPDPQRA